MSVTAALKQLVGQPISSNTTFNWTWFIELVTCSCLALFFLFYFNRLFATLVSYGLRAFTWHKYRVWVDIQALQLSLLGGRLFFKGIRYHGENETVFVQNGFITWRYWQRSSRQVDLSSDAAAQDGDEPLSAKVDPTKHGSDGSDAPTSDQELGAAKKLDGAEARIAINIAGLEWFIYNRTPVYDAIVKVDKIDEDQIDNYLHGGQPPSVLDNLHRRKRRTHTASSHTGHDVATGYESAGPSATEKGDGDGDRHNPRLPGSIDRVDTRTSTTSVAPEPAAPVSPFYSLLLRMLPVAVDCSRGAITLGNENTRAIVVSTFASARGRIDASAAGPADIFRQIFDFDIHRPKVEMKPNPDYRRSQLAAAERIILAAESTKRRRPWWQVDLGLRRRTGRAWRALKHLTPGLSSSRGSLKSARSPAADDGKPHYFYDEFQATDRSWHGLGRYMDEDERDDHEGWSHVEYARFSQILDSPLVHLNFYWDIAGHVTEEHAAGGHPLAAHDINRAPPPAYGLDLTVKGGSVNWGPWADRLRLELQAAFLPNAYRSPVPAEALQVGDARVSTVMTIRVDLEDEVSLRVPTRERSKDWQWRGRAHAVKEAAAIRKQREKRHFRFRRPPKTKLGADVRPFGWLTVSAGPDSTVRYDMDMFPGHSGYSNQLRLDLKDTKATSSVNHALLWRCRSQRISCDLSNPLTWNGLHTWTFNVDNEAMEMFLLRDHFFLLTDLISDFTAGAKPDYMTFVPYLYQLHLTFPDLKIYLNANDYNIIDNPVDLEENAFLILAFQQLNGTVDIPMELFSPRQSSVKFIADGHNASLELVTPVWNTLSTLAEDSIMATLKGLDLEGSYNYYAAVSPTLTDSLFMTITGYAPVFHLHGYLIRYFMNVKENYFGEDLHFRTLEEYQDQLADDEVRVVRSGTKKENDLDVILTVRADKSCVLLPANIYSQRENVRVDVLLVEADMRFTNYYMDLQVSSSPLEVALESIVSATDQMPEPDITNCQLFVDGLEIYGHRLFGAPPTEPTYVCNWDINLGQTTGECSSKFLQTLIGAIMAFIYTLDDDENALPELGKSPLHDVTFLRASLAGLRLWLISGDAAFLVELSGTDVSFGDWAGYNFAKTLRADVPRVLLAAVNYKNALRRHDRGTSVVETFACFQTSLRIDSLDKTDNLANTRALQQQHVRYHDQRTRRTGWLLQDSRPTSAPQKKADWAREHPAMPVPIMPEPLGKVEGPRSLRSNVQSGQRGPMIHQSSFLSTSSSPLRTPAIQGLSERGHSASREDPALHLSVTQTTYGPSMSERTVSRRGNVSIRSNTQDGDGHPGLVTLANPWAPPHFTLNDVKPNTRNMPHPPEDLAASEVDEPDDGDPSWGDDFENTPHNGLFCMVNEGLTGFCAPAFFLSIGELIRALNDDRAIDQLDKVQISMMKKILEAQKRSDQSHVLDLAIQVPCVRIRLINGHLVGRDLSPSTDQYDLTIVKTTVMLRTMHLRTDSQSHHLPQTHFLGFGSTKSLSLSVRDDAFDDRKAAAHAEVSLSDCRVWAKMKDEVNSKLQLNKVDVVSWAEELAKMAALIQRTIVTVERIADAFSGLDPTSKYKHLIYHLTEAGKSVADPIFLTRPSYVLRSADNHVRLTDSWKIMSRLRYILATLEKDKPGPNGLRCNCESLELADMARKQVLSSFDQWRGWDYARDKTTIISHLFDNRAPGLPTKHSKDRYTQSEVLIGKLDVILDPGPQQSDLSLAGIDFNIVLYPLAPLSGQEKNAERVILKAYFADASLNLNWALLELVRQLLDLGNPLTTGRRKADHVGMTTPKPYNKRRQFTVVVGTDAASVHLTTVNLKVKWAAESFRAASSFDTGVSQPTMTSFAAAGNSALVKIKGHTRTLLMWRLRSPKMYGAILPHTQNASSKAKTTVRLCAASNKLRFEMKEDIVKLLTVVESVLDDEVLEVTRLVDRVRDFGGENSGQSPASDDPDVDLHVATFLNDYRLSFCVVPSLYYAIAGKVARTSVSPRQDGTHDINFDIKKHHHSFEVPHSLPLGSLSILEMPPINGQLSVGQRTGLVQVRSRVTIEQINLEAAGVRACFDALNQPGVIQLIPRVKELVERIQASVDQLKGAQSALRETQTSEALLLLRFAIHGTLAGLRIHFSAPTEREGDHYRADMELKLDGTTVFVHNEARDPGSIHDQPQFVLNSQGVGIGVYRATDFGRTNVGNCVVGLKALGETETDGKSGKVHVYRAWSDEIKVDLYEETANVVVDIAAFLQDRIKSIRLADDADNIRRLRRMTAAGITDRLKPKENVQAVLKATTTQGSGSSALYNSTYALNLANIQVRWNLTNNSGISPTRDLEDLVFSIRKVDLQTRQEGTARLSILDTQLQIVPQSISEDPTQRTPNSALLPEVIFGSAYLSTKKDRRFAFQAKGKALDLRLASDFIVPAHALQRSIAKASEELRRAKKPWNRIPESTQTQPIPLRAGKRLASLLVDADFAGAIVHIIPRLDAKEHATVFGGWKGKKRSRAGRYGQAVQGDNVSSAVLRAPGVALKVEYKDCGTEDPTLSTEVKVAASSNTLYPTVVPLILEISSSIKEILGDDEPPAETAPPAAGSSSSYLSDATISSASPTAILGRCKLNAGLYIQRQEFSLSCQPIARVAATARFADIFVTINTVSAPDQDRFFAILTTFNKLEASVQHVYSRESTASFEVESVVLSLMNSKHVTANAGISAVLNVSPMKTDINAKQLQDFLLFREIWYPAELRGPSKPNAVIPSTQDQQAYAMQRYQELYAKGTLPWHGIVSVEEIKLEVDLGQGLGKSVFTISKFWASSRKSSDSEQDLCVGFDRVGVDSSGRMSGFIELANFRLRTSIRWPEDATRTKAPLVQASLAFEHFRVKAAFDYQPFAVADISFFEFLMYNVRQGRGHDSDRLVGIVDGSKVQVFCTTATAAQGFALVQAFERLVQEKQEAYATSLRDLDKFLRRKSVFPTSNWTGPPAVPVLKERAMSRGAFALHTDVVVTLKAVDIGAFPNTFFDNQILKIEATEVQARFAVATTNSRTHSGLGMRLGQVRVALSNVNRVATKALSDVTVPDVIERATTARGGTIVQVPRLMSSMETWQLADSNTIEYTFRSTFEGKVDVGWNYARISFIRGMWQTHSRALAQRLGKPLAPSAVKITAEPQGEGQGGQEKITAVVNVPQSRFTYIALEPPIIDTPQLRDMGEATPPLEWIGLHRDRLPEATHSIVIVSLLEIAREVEDAYTRILGAS